MSTLKLNNNALQKNKKTEAEFVDEFISYVEGNYTSILDQTTTDDEVIYLMMGSLGRLADLFKVGSGVESEIIKQCKSIAAAALAISLPSDEDAEEGILLEDKETTSDKVTPIRDKQKDKKTSMDIKFFVYRQHSHGMTMRLELWRKDNMLDFTSWKCGGEDKNGRPLICTFNQDEELEAFLVCGNADVKKQLIEYMRIAYPID